MVDQPRSSGSDPRPFDDWDAVVFDLDGTLVQLAVDWDAVAAAVASLYRSDGVEVADDDLWSLLERAADAGLEIEVESTIAAHERTGALRSDRLPAADRLLAETRPAGVCSLNCEAACWLALETHGLHRAVRAVVGRDTVSTRKPDPGPLIETIDALGSTPDGTIFVGDSKRDELTARRAGTGYVHVSDLSD